jgi:DNA helicase-2/ATP-dependent DNA helicase PcrA
MERVDPSSDIGTILNNDQLKAVTHREGPMLVLAGAGTGKTRILEYRVANLIEAGVNPLNILLLTFTREAASEMLNRAASNHLQCREVQGGTFHGFAYRMIKQEAERKKIRNKFTILDNEDELTFLWRFLSQDPWSKLVSAGFSPELIREIFSYLTRKLIPLRDLLSNRRDGFGLPEIVKNNTLKHIELLESFWQAINKEKDKHGYLTFDDLLYKFFHLLSDAEFAGYFSQEYRYVMVDEYQDTNPLQAAIVMRMGELIGNVMVVGDDAQCIFGFTGASVYGLREFERKFGSENKVVLKINYRSTQNILDLANALTDNMPEVLPRKLEAHYTAPSEEDNEIPIRFRSYAKALDEAEFISRRVSRLLNHDEIPLDQQCVLFRNTYLSNILQTVLARDGIPFIVKGGVKFADLPHVKEVMAFFRIIRNPLDILAWQKVLKLHADVKENTIRKVGALIERQTNLLNILDADWDEENKGIFRIIRPSQSAAYISKLKSLLRRLSLLEANPGEMAKQTIEFYREIIPDRYGDKVEEVMLDLDSLIMLAKSYNSLDSFVDAISLESPQKSLIQTKDEVMPDEPRLTLSTIHSAKGREWEAVFIMGLKDGELPDYRSFNDEEKLQEEHRLLYVAVTRAKKHLMLTMNKETGRSAKGTAALSRFLIKENVYSRLKFVEIG